MGMGTTLQMIFPKNIWFTNSAFILTFLFPKPQNQLDMTCDAAMSWKLNPTKMSDGFFLRGGGDRPPLLKILQLGWMSAVSC